MNVSVSGIHIDIGQAFNTYVSQEFEQLCEKYNLSIIDASVQLSRNSIEFRTDITAHIGKNVVLRGHGEGPNANSSFDNALFKLGQRLRRHKERLVHHHKHRDIHVPEMIAPSYVLPAETAEHDKSPAVIAEMETAIPTLSVGDAVMRLDLSGESALMFQNEANGSLNMVYCRADGNIGWVNPDIIK